MVLASVKDRRALGKETDGTRMLGARAGVHGHEEVQRGLEGERELVGQIIKGWRRTGHSPKDRRKAGAFAEFRPAEETCEMGHGGRHEHRIAQLPRRPQR